MWASYTSSCVAYVKSFPYILRTYEFADEKRVWHTYTISSITYNNVVNEFKYNNLDRLLYMLASDLIDYQIRPFASMVEREKLELCILFKKKTLVWKRANHYDCRKTTFIRDAGFKYYRVNIEHTRFFYSKDLSRISRVLLEQIFNNNNVILFLTTKNDNNVAIFRAFLHLITNVNIFNSWRCISFFV